MAGKRGRIDRRLSAASAKVLEQPADAVAVFRDGWGEVAKRYDLGKLGLPTDVTMLLADARTNVNAPGRNGRNALSFASGNGHDSIVLTLLGQSTCKAGDQDGTGATPFFLGSRR